MLLLERLWVNFIGTWTSCGGTGAFEPESNVETAVTILIVFDK